MNTSIHAWLHPLYEYYINFVTLLAITKVGSDISYFHQANRVDLIRHLLQELPDLGLLCLQKR